MTLVIAHTIGVIGLVFFALSFQYSSPRRLLYLFVLGGVAMTVHFALLGVYTAAIINLIMAARAYVYYQSKRRDSWAIPTIFAGVLLVATALTWQGYISLLPAMAGLISAYALWSDSSQHIRWFMLACSLFWITHNIIVVSPVAVVSDMISIISIIIGLWRYRRYRNTIQKTP